MLKRAGEGGCSDHPPPCAQRLCRKRDDMINTLSDICAQPFFTAAKRAIVNLINETDDPLTRDDRIQVALDGGLLTAAEAYQLRTNGDL